MPTTVTLRAVAGSMGFDFAPNRRCGFCDCAALAQNDEVGCHPAPTPPPVSLHPTPVTLREVAGSMVLRRAVAVDSATALRLRRMTEKEHYACAE